MKQHENALFKTHGVNLMLLEEEWRVTRKIGSERDISRG